jgi:toxin ParE1/3/4
MKLTWEDRALSDLQQAISYIAIRSPQNAEMVLDELLKLSESLVLFPEKFPIEPIFNKKNIRFVTKWSFKMIYQIEKEELIILRIFSTHQNPNKIKE